jgi:hypothetical protein
MSAIRDVRLLIARHLDIEIPVKSCILDVMNILDASLDAEGYEAPPELHAALRRLDRAIIEGDDTDADLPFDDDEEDDEDDDFVDLEDIETLEDDDDDDDDDVEFDDDDDDDED